MRSIVILSLPYFTIAAYGLATHSADRRNESIILPIDSLVTRSDSSEVPLTQDENQCNGVSGDYWVERDVAVANAQDFCNQERQMMSYNIDTDNELELYVENLNTEIDERSPKDAPDCLSRFQTAVIDGCDGNDPLNNPHNYKFGSTLLTADGWKYRMTPLSKHVNEVGCDVSYKARGYNVFEVRGKNLPDALLGANGEGLLKKLSGCGQVKEWNFEQTPDDCCYSWYALGRLPGGTKSCVGRAIKSAGGSSNGGCRGPGKRDPGSIESWPGYGDSDRHVFAHPATQMGN
jgi:hypothetical protein